MESHITEDKNLHLYECCLFQVFIMLSFQFIQAPADAVSSNVMTVSFPVQCLHFTINNYLHISFNTKTAKTYTVGTHSH